MDIDNFVCEADKYINSTDGSISVFLQVGYHKCMKFEKDILKAGNFSEALIISCFESNVHVFSAHFFDKDYKVINDNTPKKASQKNTKFLALSFLISSHPVVKKGRYSYKR